IVPVHALGLPRPGTTDSFFTMKLIRGRDLKEVLDQLGEERLDGPNLEQLVDIIIRCCNALSFAHDQGVIHRDLKPTNVMVGAHGQAYVMDWGLAFVEPASRAEIPQQEYNNAIGTPAFMAPEQAWPEPDKLGPATDVFGLGALLYAILTGGPVFRGKTPVETVLLARNGEVTPPQELVPQRRLPPELCRITMTALSRQVEERYATPAELRRDLEQFQRGGGWLETRAYDAGQAIVCEGEEAHEAYIVIDGRCDVVKGSRHIKTLGPGEVFGETVFLNAGRRTATVVAQTDCLLKVVTRQSLESELMGKGWLRLFIATLTERFGELTRQLDG
ncbi:MAG: cyclic nucleotide-binding domain-containing protein, partial [Myxococcota bacterium]